MIPETVAAAAEVAGVEESPNPALQYRTAASLVDIGMVSQTSRLTYFHQP
jgi:hypothetical protein